MTLYDCAGAVLTGAVLLLLRVRAEAPRRSRAARSARGGAKPPPVDLDAAAQQRMAALKAWRGEVAREHNVPAYVVFHDATLAEMARRRPADLAELGTISGVGAKKLDAYGQEILRVLQAA